MRKVQLVQQLGRFATKQPAAQGIIASAARPIGAQRHVAYTETAQVKHRLVRRTIQDGVVGENAFVEAMVGCGHNSVRRQRDNVSAQVDVPGNQPGR